MPDSSVSPTLSNYAKPWGLWATLGFSALVLAGFVLTQTLIFFLALAVTLSQGSTVAPEMLIATLASNGLVLAIATLVSNPLGMALVVLFAKLRKKMAVSVYLSLKRTTRRQLLEWCLVLIISVVAIDLLKSLADQPVVPDIVVQLYQTSYFLPLFYLAVVVMAPLFEELLFRGFMFQGLKHSSWGKVGAVVAPALLWALIHAQYGWVDIGGLVIIGVVLGIARLQTNSIYVPMAMHALNNFMAILQVALLVHFS